MGSNPISRPRFFFHRFVQLRRTSALASAHPTSKKGSTESSKLLSNGADVCFIYPNRHRAKSHKTHTRNFQDFGILKSHWFDCTNVALRIVSERPKTCSQPQTRTSRAVAMKWDSESCRAMSDRLCVPRNCSGKTGIDPSSNESAASV